jgi:hypothetical protein
MNLHAYENHELAEDIRASIVTAAVLLSAKWDNLAESGRLAGPPLPKVIKMLN